HCGRQAGGSNARQQGICPAGVDVATPGPNRGLGGGRICWSVAGTYCTSPTGNDAQSTRVSCTGCEVFKQVQQEEGAAFELLAPGHTAHQALLEQFTSLVSIVESINAIVYVADLETYELLFVNPYTAKLFGGDILGKRCFQVLQTGQSRPCTFCTNHRLVVDGMPTPPVVWEFQNTVTQRWFLCTDRAIRWWDGRLVRMEIALDVSDRKAAELHRDQVLHLITHDLRNPLNALMLRASTLQRRVEKKGLTEEHAALGQLLGNARQINALIEELLETSFLETGAVKLDRSSLDLREWVANSVRASPPEERDRVRISAGPGQLKVSADPGRLERAFQNLLSNAFKFSGDPVTIAVERQGDEAVVSVSDRGVGVPADELPRLFQRFFRGSTAGQTRGIGLGLYSTRLMIEAHGGRIWAESEPGQGSTFHFALPMAVTEAG
ncbi:MAG: hybrid sensor histidine kinase/response regulator, partial [Myxococcaceae bacterium]|nr:hybrid sensor histidine kinase/response regulator [Myxococcaceae bacterium]